MTPASTHMPGEDVATHTVDAADSPGTRPAAPLSMAELRSAAAHNELQQLRDELAARDIHIGQLQQQIANLQAQPKEPAATMPASTPSSDGAASPPRLRGAMSARVDAGEPAAGLRAIEHAAMHATATGKRRDLLSYLRLRRKKNNTT